MESPTPPEPLLYDIGLTGIGWLLISAVVILFIGRILLKRYPNSMPKIALGCICAFATMVFAVVWTILVDNTWSGFSSAIVVGAICSAVFGYFTWILIRVFKERRL